MTDTVAVKRWWLEQVRECLQGDLPSGRKGDTVFLLREMLGDLLQKRTLTLPPTYRVGGKWRKTLKYQRSFVLVTFP